MFDLLDDVDAAEMRHMQRRNMPHRCAVYDVSTVTAPGGDWSIARVQPAVYEGVCRLSPLGEAEREKVIAGALDASSAYRVIFPAGTPLSRTQEIDVTGVNRTDEGNVAFAMTLDVEAVEPVNVAIEITRKVIAKVKV